MKPNDLHWFINQLAGASLTLVEDGEKVKTFLLKKYPDSSDYSAWLFFTPIGIVISGDLSVADHGVIAPGYGLDWFASRQDPDYLAEKFLKTKWVPDLMRTFFRERADKLDQDIKTYRDQIVKDWADENDGETPSNNEIDEQMPELLRRYEWKVGSQQMEGTQADAIRFLLQCDEESGEIFNTPDRLDDYLPAYRCQKGNAAKQWTCPYDCYDMGRGYGYEPGEIGWLTAIQTTFSTLYPQLKEATKKNETQGNQ
jgi:hypothetical protein